MDFFCDSGRFLFHLPLAKFILCIKACHISQEFVLQSMQRVTTYAPCSKSRVAMGATARADNSLAGTGTAVHFHPPDHDDHHF